MRLALMRRAVLRRCAVPLAFDAACMLCCGSGISAGVESSWVRLLLPRFPCACVLRNVVSAEHALLYLGAPLCLIRLLPATLNCVALLLPCCGICGQPAGSRHA